jgi:NAD/NADP transhydrogenase alpha subunit
VLLAGSSATADLGSTFGVNTSWASEFVIDGVVNLICAGLLVVGGIWLAERKPAGQLMLTVANMVVAADAVYWTVRFNSYAALIPSAVVFGALAVVGAALTWTADTRTWLTAEETGPKTIARP